MTASDPTSPPPPASLVSLPPFTADMRARVGVELLASSAKNEQAADDYRREGKTRMADWMDRQAGMVLIGASIVQSKPETSASLYVRSAALLARVEAWKPAARTLLLILHESLGRFLPDADRAAHRAARAQAGFPEHLNTRHLEALNQDALLTANTVVDRMVSMASDARNAEAARDADLAAGRDPAYNENGLHNLRVGAASLAMAATSLSLPTLVCQHAAIAGYLYTLDGQLERARVFAQMAKEHPSGMPSRLFAHPDGCFGPDVEAWCEKHGIVLPRPN